MSYAFDSNGRPYSVSTPCVISYAQTCSTPKTTQTYDALNRPFVTTDGGGGTVTYSYSNNDVLVTIGPAPSGENTKRRQLEYDSLGRLTSVCELTSLSGSGTCGQTNSQTGYWTKYSYDALGNLLTVTQNAQASSGSQQTRTYNFDAMSRLTSETNPESGTTAYTYDSDASCGSSSGDLVKLINAVGNMSCYYRDALHRITAKIIYYSPNQQGNQYFVYDTATVNGQAMQKGMGRLVEAFTAGSPTSSKITDEGFSYTARGEVSDVYESTPNSGGYYHSSAIYWPNGVLSQLNGPGGYQAGWNVDGEGRVYSNYNTGGNPLSSTTYNAASQPTQVNFASSDSDSFTYDPNTGRMTQYRFNVNASSLTGALGWNANGTLRAQNITDAFNSANTQNCLYGYDDVTRITSANCGSVAAQTFAFDAFGNISKSGSPYSFNPTYSTSTNRMTSLGSFTPTYDNDGNLLSDNIHSYAWDADGNSVSLDGVAITFDALDRMVEQNRSGAYTQFVYSPIGFKMEIMNGQATQKAFVPLPAGAMAVYTSAGLTYIHADWLGSPRLGSTPSRTTYFDVAYAPFGETYDSSGSTDPAFTGQRQDTVTGLYDFLFREYSIQGRWASPDPAGLAAVDPSNPQSWNRYTYVLNDPTDLADPLGLCAPGTICVISVLCPGGPLTCSSGQGSSGPSGLGSLLSGGGNPDAPFLSCEGFVEANCAPPPPPLKCVRPSAFQRAGISIQGAIAASTGTAVGVGAGATVAGGNKIGITLSISRQIVVTPNGQAAFVTTFTPIAPTGFNSYVSPGVGGYGGFQLSFSNAQNPQNLGGGGFNVGYGGGRGWGGGVDGSVGWSNNGPIFQATFTAGAGLGVPGATGHGLAPIYTVVTPICTE